MIPDYELLNTLQKIQTCLADMVVVAPKFNHEALTKLKEHEKTTLQLAVEVVQNQEEHEEETSKEATRLIINFTRLAVKLQHDNDLTHLWLTNQGVQAGVNKDGKIVLWASYDPSICITVFEQ
jgi:hypothetical protein